MAYNREMNAMESNLIYGFSIFMTTEHPSDPKEMRHLEQNDTLCVLTDEIRTAFENYNDITADEAALLSYLQASLQAGLLMSSTFPLARSSKCFFDPLRFRPARWLLQDHALYHILFTGDEFSRYQPFSQGPRACMGKEIALVAEQKIDIDRDLRVYGMYVKPEVRVRFIPYNREVP
ncbi:cytochrome P450 [Xylaria arbuscula]|nr:cytochrome P450 [Xylaria arbuscula]